MAPPFDAAAANALGQPYLPGLLGLRFIVCETGRAVAELDVETRHLAPNGFLHAATVVALADTAAGYGCVASLPDGASGFTTVGLQANFLGTALAGTIRAEALMRHGGRTTQTWDAEVTGPEGKTLALFRCTQMVLYPRK